MDKEKKTGLPENLREVVNNLSEDMDDVRVHTIADCPQLGALVYTQGAEIHVAPGQEEHLPHGMWQVVQQEQHKRKNSGS